MTVVSLHTDFPAAALAFADSGSVLQAGQSTTSGYFAGQSLTGGL